MEVLKDSSPNSGRLRETSFDTQNTRQRLGDHWQPRGFERYGYQKALLDGMPVISGSGGNPDRYRPAMTCMDTLDCHCGE